MTSVADTVLCWRRGPHEFANCLYTEEHEIRSHTGRAHLLMNPLEQTDSRVIWVARKFEKWCQVRTKRVGALVVGG
jgi:hypothetical protein